MQHIEISDVGALLLDREDGEAGSLCVEDQSRADGKPRVIGEQTPLGPAQAREDASLVLLDLERRAIAALRRP